MRVSRTCAHWGVKAKHDFGTKSKEVCKKKADNNAEMGIENEREMNVEGPPFRAPGTMICPSARLNKLDLILSGKLPGARSA